MTSDGLRADLLEGLRRTPLVGVLRRCPPDSTVAVVSAAVDAGLVVVEVTMDSEGAAEQIAALVDTVGDRAIVGAGTVTDPELAKLAVDAGATFLVAPDLHVPVVEAAQSLGRPMIPGVFTPTEVAVARRAGCTMLKLFPAGPVGPSYMRALMGPFSDVSFIATGAIAPTDVGLYLAAGAIGVGLGSELFPIGADGDISAISAAVASAVRSASAGRPV